MSGSDSQADHRLDLAIHTVSGHFHNRFPLDFSGLVLDLGLAFPDFILAVHGCTTHFTATDSP